MAEDGVATSTNAKWNFPVLVFFKDARSCLELDSLGREVLSIAVPAALALAADPIASLIDTVFIGRIGSVEIAAVGVSIALFNQLSKIAIFPLVSITTSFVAEEETVERIKNRNIEDENTEKNPANKEGREGMILDDSHLDNLENGSIENAERVESAPPENDSKTMPCTTNAQCTTEAPPPKLKRVKRNIPSASTALLFGLVLGVLLTLVLVLLAKPLLSLMGVKSGSPMLTPALKYLTLRSLGAPAVLLSLAMQGVFRGFKDTKTPLYATVVGDVANIILDPILMFACNLGVGGAAIAHVLSQYLITLILLVKLIQQVNLLPPSTGALQFGRFLKNGNSGNYPCDTGCVVSCKVGCNTYGCIPDMLTDLVDILSSLTVAGQAIIASSFAEKNYEKATATASRVLQMGFVMGLGVALLIGLGLEFGSGIFTKDINVRHIISIGVPFVAGTQPINSIAFVFYGVNFGASDFAYSAYSMILVSGASIGSLFGLYEVAHFVGIWLSLTIFMALRAIAGIWRMGTGTGPWSYLRN